MAKENINKDFKPLVIKEIFQAKNPRLAQLIPGFIYRYLRKTLVLDEVNEILRLHGHKKDFEFASAALDMFKVTIDVIGEQNLPKGGPFIFVANHPLGGVDGVMLLHVIGEKYERKYKALVNDILLNIKNMDGIYIPINKHGAQASKNVRYIDEIFRSENHVMTFPAGLVSRRNKGIIRDPDWQKSFITKAVKYERDVIPIHVSGRCSNFFYRLANLRKFLRIKANIEMFFLPRETFKHKNNNYVITIGKPISYHKFDKRYKPIEWAKRVKDHCYALEQDPDRAFTVN